METIEILNRRLKERFGLFLNGQPLYRVVWSEDQFEKRRITTTDEGWQLLNPIVKEVPKYRQYIQNKYILERLLEVPRVINNDMVDRVSYEPLWVFEDKDGNPLPPIWPAIEMVIHTVHAASAHAVGAKYEDPRISLADPKIARDVQEARLVEMEQALFGNETQVGDALAHKTGVTVPELPRGN